ncbi:MAG: MFS transporter [Pseudomonadota bacterium]
MWRFVAENRRWLGAGVLLTFAASFGQTWHISLYAGQIRAEYGLSDGAWGSIYTAATLASAVLLMGRGGLADTMPLGRLAPIIAAFYALAALLMALGQTVALLVLAVFALRFCGQGMFWHISMTAMGRWFVATRGRAVSIAGLGVSLGEVLLPLPMLGLAAWLGWRGAWGVAAVSIAVIVLPVLAYLLAQDRDPSGTDTTDRTAGLDGRHWTRTDALRHWLFWALLPLMMTPGFIGTVFFFHQAHVAEVKGWTLAAMAPAYPVFAGASVAMMLTAGRIADAVGPERMLPVTLLAMGAGCALIGPSTAILGWVVALGCLGASNGMFSALIGTLLPQVYGTQHLGSIRALAAAIMVFATAIGPGLTGWLIDLGIDFPDQGLGLALWCAAISLAMLAVLVRLNRATA